MPLFQGKSLLISSDCNTPVTSFKKGDEVLIYADPAYEGLLFFNGAKGIVEQRHPTHAEFVLVLVPSWPHEPIYIHESHLSYKEK